jgi:glutaredoxin
VSENYQPPAGSESIRAVQLYWRPGCGFCSSLLGKLKDAPYPIEMHNIWEEPESAARVRSAARGNETVPTVFIGDDALVNPSASQILETVRHLAPHLLELTPGE